MKHLFKLWIAATLLFIAGCSESYDDSEVWNSINSLEKRMSAMETVMNAYKNKLSIDSLTPIENGYRITFSDGSQATITNGKDGADGKDGDTYIESFTIGENEVIFVLTDGRQLTIPLSSSYLFKRIQSITYLPAYEDGKANMVFRSAKDSYAELDFLVSPKEAVSEIEEGWEFFLSMQGYHTKTRSVDFIEMKITNCFADADSGVLTITVSGENLCEEFYTGEKGANGVLKVSDGNTDIDSNIVPFIAVASETPPNNEIWYTTSDNKIITPAKVDQWGNETSFGANIISNTYIDGKGVITFDGDITQIGNLAFANHEWNNFRTKNLTDIRLPDCVTKISSLAFSGCNLEEFRLPKNLSIIESAAFEANNFKQITIPSNVTFIGEYAFQDNKNLTEVTNLSKDLLVVDGRAFRRCKLQSFKGELSSTDGRCLIKNGTLVACATSGLTEYSIPDNVKTISSYAFALRDYLTKITIPEGVTKIEEGAFWGCSSLLEITIPASVTEIDDGAGIGAFWDCTSLKSIDLQNSIIGDYQFYMCTSLTNVTIPDNIKIIGDCAFAGCFSLTTVKLGKNVEIIGNSAFSDTKLSSITIPESVVSIGDGAFKNDNLMEIKGKFASEDHTALIIDKKLIHLADGTCKSYTSYTIPAGVEEIGSGAFLWYENLSEIIIPEGVKRIGMHGLGSCTGLTSLTLPSTITNLGNYVFLNLPKVGEIYFNSITPPNIWDVVIAGYWNPCDKGVILRVPEKSVEAYKASEWWGNYKIASFDEEIYTSTDFSQDGVVKTIQTATEGNGIDIVIMGDGYSDRQIANGKYDKDLSKALDMLFNEEPYKSLKHLFNINQVIAVSHGEEIGAGKTAFSGYLGEGTLAGGDDSKVFEYAQKAISADRVDEATIIVIMNKERYAGTCYMYHPSKTADYGTGTSISYFPLGTNDDMLAGLICHEAGGHGFAKLGDEYAYESMGNIPSSEINNHKTQQNSWGWWKNVEFTSDPSAIRWNHFINDTRYANEGLGAYEGGLTYWTGVWRPTENSIMRYNTGDFNVPSREAIYYRIHKLAYGADWEYDYEEFVEWDARNRSNYATTRGVPYKSAINKPTHPPVIVNKSWRDAK